MSGPNDSAVALRGPQLAIHRASAMDGLRGHLRVTEYLMLLQLVFHLLKRGIDAFIVEAG